MDHDEELINAVKNHSCLYDLESPNYKNILQKEAVWDEIARQIGLNAETCRKKWKILRDTFRRSKRNAILASGSGASSSRRKMWKHHDAMSFLDNLQTCGTTIGSISAEDDADCDSPSAYEHDDNRSTPRQSMQQSQRSTPTPGLASLQRNRQLNEVFGVAVDGIAASAQQIAASFKPLQESKVDMAFSGLAKIVNVANMPDELEKSVIHEVQTVVFGAVQDWTARNIDLAK